jgi:TatD DNase family protein
MWIDTHCHPFLKDFDEDRAEVLQNAKLAGVEAMIVVGYDPEANRQALAMADQHDFMWATLGIHPNHSGFLSDEEFDWIRTTAKTHPRVVALGEMGLDYYHMKSSKENQAETFRRQIRLAKELDLPCIVHSRDAAEDTLSLLLEEQVSKVIFHCFSYDLDFGKKVWSAGYFTSFSGVITYPNSKGTQEAAKHAPADLILIETDSPWLAPQSHRGQRNEPAFVSEVGLKLAELRGESPQVLSEQLRHNTRTIFGKMFA